MAVFRISILYSHIKRNWQMTIQIDLPDDTFKIDVILYQREGSLCGIYEIYVNENERVTIKKENGIYERK